MAERDATQPSNSPVRCVPTVGTSRNAVCTSKANNLIWGVDACKCRRIYVADVASDASAARYSKFQTLNPCEAMLTIRMLFAFQPTLIKWSKSILQWGFRWKYPGFRYQHAILRIKAGDTCVEFWCMTKMYSKSTEKLFASMQALHLNTIVEMPIQTRHFPCAGTVVFFWFFFERPLAAWPACRPAKVTSSAHLPPANGRMAINLPGQNIFFGRFAPDNQ